METTMDTKTNFMTDIANSASENTTAALNEFSKKLQQNSELVKDKAQAAVEELKTSSNQAINTLGEKIQQASATVADKAQAHPDYAAEIKTVADGLESTGKYLKKRDLNQIGSDLAETVRQHPVKAAALVLGLGLLIGQALFRR